MLISNSLHNSCITFEVNAVPISERIVLGMYVDFMNMLNNCCATFGALAFLNGVANKYFVNVSFAVSMWLKPPESGNRPTRSICSISPGRYLSVATDSKGGFCVACFIGFT